MKSLLVLLLALHGSASFAVETSGLQQSVLKMDFIGEKGYSTVFPVTPDGYFLTALHCVRSCLMEQGRAEQAADIFLGLEDLFVVHNPSNTKAHCQKMALPALAHQGLEVVATGSALALYDARFMAIFGGLQNELKVRGWESKANDYAVLKIEGKSHLPCLRFAPTPVPAGSQLEAWGFPVPAVKEEKPVLKSALGSLYGGAEESAYFRHKSTEDERRFVLAQFNAPGVLYSSAATDDGYSGGPILAPDHSVLGVISGYSNTLNPDKSITHELTGTSIQKLLGELPEELSLKLQRGNRYCQ